MMARPPLELETWGKIRRTTIAGKPTAVCRYRDSDGVTRPMQRQGKTPAEAERNLIKALKKRLAPAGEDLTGNSTVRAAGARWLAEPERDDLAVATRARYRQALETIIGKGFGDVRLAEATLDRWIASTEAGDTITVDWGEPPARVTLRGVTVKVERRQVRVPDKTQDRAWTAETAWILTRVGEGPIDTMQQWDTDDRGGMILSQVSGSIAVFAAHLLDTALVLLAGGE